MLVDRLDAAWPKQSYGHQLVDQSQITKLDAQIRALEEDLDTLAVFEVLTVATSVLSLVVERLGMIPGPTGAAITAGSCIGKLTSGEGVDTVVSCAAALGSGGSRAAKAAFDVGSATVGTLDALLKLDRTLESSQQARSAGLKALRAARARLQAFAEQRRSQSATAEINELRGAIDARCGG